MTTTYIGELTLGVAVPLPVALVSQAQFTLQAQVDATLAASINVQLPTTLLELLALAQSILAALESMLLHGLEPPSLSLQGAIFAQTLAQLSLQLAPFLAFATLMATGGVFGYVYDGPTNGAGGELTTELAGGFPGHGATDHCNLLVLGAKASATWTAMQAMFRTSP